MYAFFCVPKKLFIMKAFSRKGFGVKPCQTCHFILFYYVYLIILHVAAFVVFNEVNLIISIYFYSYILSQWSPLLQTQFIKHSEKKQ